VRRRPGSDLSVQTQLSPLRKTVLQDLAGDRSRGLSRFLGFLTEKLVKLGGKREMEIGHWARH
jgi:hypothetical protein